MPLNKFKANLIVKIIIICALVYNPLFVSAKVITPEQGSKSVSTEQAQPKQVGGDTSTTNPFNFEKPDNGKISEYQVNITSHSTSPQKVSYQNVDSNVRAWGKYFGLADSVVRIKEYPNITIKGSDEFIKKVEGRFNSILATQYGQDLFKNILDTGKKITVVEYTNNNSYAEAKDLTSATQQGEKVRDGNGALQKTWLGKDIIGTGKGTDVIVHLNPDLDFKGIKGCTGFMPNDAVFFHELTHAQRMMQGRLLETKDKQYDTIEEKRAINGEHPNETDYLTEIKAPYIRFSHTCQMVKI